MDHLSLVGIVPWEFVAQIANLLIQAALFKKFLFKPVQGIIAKRRGEVNAIYGEAEAARTAAEEEKAEYDRLMRNARVEAGQIVKAAAENAEARATQLIQSAQQEAAGIKEKAYAEIDREKKKTVNEIKDNISGMVVALAEKVVEKEINAGDQQAPGAAGADQVQPAQDAARAAGHHHHRVGHLVARRSGQRHGEGGKAERPDDGKQQGEPQVVVPDDGGEGELRQRRGHGVERARDDVTTGRSAAAP